jgi:hypothetical protein
MQLLEKPIINRQKKPGKILPATGSFNMTSLPAKVVNIMPVRTDKKREQDTGADFANWNMPEQETGVIKCRKHDFF